MSNVSNGIIVVKVPDKCCNCRMCFENEYYDQFECYFKPGTEIRVDEEKQEWCPIKEIPERCEEIKFPHSMNDFQRKGFSRGFNACLDQICDK